MKIRDLFRAYEPPVDEAGWNAITGRPELRRYNRRQRIRRIVRYGIPASAVIITGVVIALVATRRDQPDTTPRPIGIEQSANPTPVLAPLENLVPTPIESQPEPRQRTVSEGSVPLPSPEAAGHAETGSAHAPKTVSASTPVNAPVVEQVSTIAADPIPNTISAPTVPTQPLDPIEPISPEDTTTFDEYALEVSEEENSENVDEYALYIPNAFTPNGDGINDLFYPKADFEPTHYEMYIYTRKGELVFTSKDIQIGWDGMRYGSTLPTDVYTYLILYVDPTGKKETRRGQITLMK